MKSGWCVVSGPCDDKPCLNGGTCVVATNTETGYTCVCQPGWTGEDCIKREYCQFCQPLCRISVLISFRDDGMDGVRNVGDVRIGR